MVESAYSNVSPWQNVVLIEFSLIVGLQLEIHAKSVANRHFTYPDLYATWGSLVVVSGLRGRPGGLLDW